MKLQDKLFGTFARLRHRVTAANTMGFGIHSPYLFNIARAIVPCRYPYYAFDAIGQLRKELLLCDDVIRMSAAGDGAQQALPVKQIARQTLRPAREEQLLMRLAVMQHAREIVVSGDGLGVSTAYLAMSDSRAHVTAFEALAPLAEVAQRNWQQLGICNICCMPESSLPGWQPAAPLDMAVISAGHSPEATMRHFEELLRHADRKSLFVLTDIHYSRSMQTAWENICRHSSVTATMDLCLLGLVFFDPNLEKKTYRIRM